MMKVYNIEGISVALGSSISASHWTIRVDILSSIGVGSEVWRGPLET